MAKGVVVLTDKEVAQITKALAAGGVKLDAAAKRFNIAMEAVTKDVGKAQEMLAHVVSGEPAAPKAKQARKQRTPKAEVASKEAAPTKANGSGKVFTGSLPLIPS